MIKNIFLALLLLTATLFAETDLRLNHYPKALEWLQDADTNGESAYNIGVIYHQKIKDNDKAIEWYEKAYDMDDVGAAGSAANNLGFLYDQTKQYKRSEKWYKKGIAKNSSNSSLGLGNLYKKLHQYDDAIFYYKKAYKMENTSGANSLGLLYDEALNDVNTAEFWYKESAKKGYLKSYKNLALFYRDQDKKINGAAWYLALIDLKYPKQKVLSYLKTKWNLTDEEIQKAYQLQKT
jgi:uncharacterized protein